MSRQGWAISIAGAVVALYIGLAAVVPPVVERLLLEQLRARGAEAPRLESVDFSPLEGRLMVRGLVTGANDAPLLAIDEAVMIWRWRALLIGDLHLELARLDGLRATLDEDDDGLRIGGIPIPRGGGSPAAGDAVLPPFRADRIQLEQGRIEYRGRGLESRVELDHLSLSGLDAGYPDKPAVIALDARVDGAALTLRGTATPLAPAPDYALRLAIGGFGLGRYAPLLAAARALDGRLDADLKLSGDLEPGAIEHRVEGEIRLADAAFEEPTRRVRAARANWRGRALWREAPNPVLELDGPLSLDGYRLEEVMAALDLDGERLEWDGALRLMPASERTALAADGRLRHGRLTLTQGGRLRAALDRLELDGPLELAADDVGLGVGWQGTLELAGLDGALAEGAERRGWRFGELRLEAERLDLELGAQQRFMLTGHLTADGVGFDEPRVELRRARLDWQGEGRWHGAADATGLALDGALRIEDLTAVIGQRFVIDQALARWQGRATLDPEDAAGSFSLTGGFGLADLRLTPAGRDRPLVRLDGVEAAGIAGELGAVGATRLALSGLVVESPNAPQDPAAKPLLKVGEIALEGWRVDPQQGVAVDVWVVRDLVNRVRRDPEGGWNLIALRQQLTGPENATAEVVAAEADADAEPAAPPIRIGRFAIEGESRIHYLDRAVTPPYERAAELAVVELRDLDSSQPERPSPVRLEARIGDHAQVRLAGEIRPFAEPPAGELKGGIEAFELPPLSTYSGRLLGYSLESGQLDAKVEVRLEAGQLAGENRLVIRKLEVAPLSSEELEALKASIGMPLETALGMLRGKDDTIRLTIPVSGALAKPDVDISDAINQAIGTALKRGALTYVGAAFFPFGTLIALTQLADGSVAVRLDPVGFDPGGATLAPNRVDYLDKVAAVLAERPQLEVKVCGRAAPADRAHYLAELEAAREAAAATERQRPAEGDRAERQRPAEPAPPLPLEVPDARLLELAEARAAAVKGHLIERHGVAASRLVSCRAAIDGPKSKADPRVELLL